MGNILISLTDGISSWVELERRIVALPSEQERGSAFEEFCKAFFVLDPVFQFKKVYNHKEIPQSLRQKLGYPGIQDIGIDGIAVSLDEKLFAYQAKFRSDRDNTPTLRELSTFFTVSDRADWRITITNANSLHSAINDRTNQSRILVDRFEQLEPEFFDRLRVYLKEQCVEPQKKKIPHQTQQEAIESALSYFKENNRGQLILPCGTGKTLISMWIAEKLGGNRLLFMVPSLSLMSQTLREWASNTSLKPFRYLCLCSDTTVDLGKDSPIEHLYEMDVPVTTDAEVVSEFLKKEPAITSILLSTYQSSRVLTEAVNKAGIGFDTAIFDEAHRTTGSDVGVWNMTLDDKNVSINKRIFMTATPRIYAPHISKKAKEKDILLYSMDDNEVYGKPFYEMTFGQAIEKNLITDYKVVIICVTDREVREIIQQGGMVVTDDNKEWDAKAFAKQVALVKALDAYKLKKVFTFHSRVPSAKAFTQADSVYRIKQVIKMLNPPHPDPCLPDRQALPQGARESSFTSPHFEKGGMGGFYDKIDLFHVNGTMSSGFRNSIMREFKESEIGIMSNARCLIEGVDVPAVDTVAFIDPKKSIIDIVQATGRALRKAEWKEKGYIFIPVVVDEDAAPEDLIKSSDFDTVWEVLQAMMDQDQRLESIVSQLRTMQGEGKEDSQKWNDVIQEYSEKVEFFNLTKKIEHKRFVEKLHTKTIEMTARSWNFWYGLTLKYKEEFGNPNAIHRYKTLDGYSLGLWQANQKQLYLRNKLSEKRYTKLYEIGFVFPEFEVYKEAHEDFLRGFKATLLYRNKNNRTNVYRNYKTDDGFPLGEWQYMIKKYYREGKLPEDKIQMLNALDFEWSKLKNDDDYFYIGIEETIKYKNIYKNANSPRNFVSPEGFRLGEWQGNQRYLFKKGNLEEDKIDLLESFGFKWKISKTPDEAFARGYLETLKYIEQFGNANALVTYKTSDNYPLGEWQAHQRRAFKKGKLDKEKIQNLQEIGLILKRDSKDEVSFEKGLQESMKYKEQFGNPNAPAKHKTQENYLLGQWQTHQRKAFNNGKLSDYKIKTLNAIGFKWKKASKDEEAFEKGYQETLKYKEQFGSPNTPVSYKTSEGYPLGQWQAHQRKALKKGKLDQEKIQKLEEIGFKWKRYSKDEASFEKGLKETIKYKDQFGNPNATAKYKTQENYSLGQWQTHQRKAFNNGKLSNYKIKTLNAIGFKWEKTSIDEEAFEKGYYETLKYKDEFGNPNAFVSYKTQKGYPLGQWQAHQRFNKEKLDRKKIRMLEEIGFIWKLKKKNN